MPGDTVISVDSLSPSDIPALQRWLAGNPTSGRRFGTTATEAMLEQIYASTVFCGYVIRIGDELVGQMIGYAFVPRNLLCKVALDGVGCFDSSGGSRTAAEVQSDFIAEVQAVSGATKVEIHMVVEAGGFAPVVGGVELEGRLSRHEWIAGGAYDLLLYGSRRLALSD